MILVIDVCSTDGAIAVRDSAGKHRIVALPGRKHSETLAPAVSNLISEKDQLEGLGVVTGPGTFTGIRVGISLALGISAATGVPLYSASKFDLAKHCLDEVSYPLRMVLPGASGRVFLATYSLGDAPPEIQLCALEDLDSEASYFGPFPIAPLQVSILPRSLLDVFLDLLDSGSLAPTPVPQPVYVNPPDVRSPVNLLAKLLNQSDTQVPKGRRGNPFTTKE